MILFSHRVSDGTSCIDFGDRIGTDLRTVNGRLYATFDDGSTWRLFRVWGMRMFALRLLWHPR